jgi:hypothetical protein
VAFGLMVLNLLPTINGAGRYRGGPRKSEPRKTHYQRRFAISDNGPHPLMER